MPAFIALFVAGYWVSTYLPVLSVRSNLTVVRYVLAEVGQDNIEHVSNAQFAYALACSIVSSACGLALAMLLCNVLVIRVSLRLAKKALLGADPRDFRKRFDAINQRLRKDLLIGHAWEEFEKTCIREDVKKDDPSKQGDRVKERVTKE